MTRKITLLRTHLFVSRVIKRTPQWIGATWLFTAGLLTAANTPIDTTAARQEILSGVNLLSKPSGGDSSHMAVYGDNAFAVIHTKPDSYVPIIAGATWEQGRVIGMGGGDKWNDFSLNGDTDDMGVLYRNIVSWSANSTELDIKIITDKLGTQTWLTTQGYTNVEYHTDWQNHLTNADVLIALMTGPSANQQTAVTNFVTAGGGLIANAFGNNKNTPTYPANVLLKDAGIAWVQGKTAFSAGPPNTATDAAHAYYAATILADSASYSNAEKDEAAQALLQTTDLFVYGSPELADLQAALAPFYDSLLMPTPDTPVSDKLAKDVLVWEGARLQEVPLNEITAHRAALPILATTPRETIIRTLSIPDDNSSQTLATGAYAAPGDMLTLKVPPTLVDSNITIKVSHLRNDNGDSNYFIMPSQKYSYSVTSEVTQFASPHGGLVEISIPASKPEVNGATIEISNAVAAPYFRLGQTTNAEWIASLRDAPTPFGVLVGDNTILIQEADLHLRTLENPHEVMVFWDQMVANINEFYNYNPRKPLRVHNDYHAIGGVSSFPQSYGINSKLVNLVGLQASGNGLTLHEYGHIADSGKQHLNGSASVESIANLGGIYGMRTNMPYLFKLGLLPHQRINAYINKPTNMWNTGSHGNVTERIVPFVLLGDIFGWETLKDIMHQLRAENTATEHTNRDKWLVLYSEITGYNLSEFFGSWLIEFSPEAEAAVSHLPNWHAMDLVKDHLVSRQGQAITFPAPSTNDFSYDGVINMQSIGSPSSGTITDNGDGTYTYQPQPGFTGKETVPYYVSNAYGNQFTGSLEITVTSDADFPLIDMGQVDVSSDGWTTVTLPNNYSSMVVATIPILSNDTPVVSRVRNASGNQFEVMLQRADGQTGVILGQVQYIVANEGVYSEEQHGVKMEVHKYISNITDSAQNWIGEPQAVAHTGVNRYDSQNIFGQVMTYNDPRWSAFWYDSNNTSFIVGKHTGEDPDQERSNETIGFICINGGSVQIGNYYMDMNNTNVARNTKFQQSLATIQFERMPKLAGALISIDVPGANDDGQWMTMHADDHGKGNLVSARVVEDTITDDDGSTSKRAGSYLAYAWYGERAIARHDIVAINSSQPYSFSLFDNDATGTSGNLSLTSLTQPANGTISEIGNGWVTYTVNNGFYGNDSFTYTLTDGSGQQSTATVTITVNQLGSPQVIYDNTNAHITEVYGEDLSNSQNSVTYASVGSNSSDSKTWGSGSTSTATGNDLGSSRRIAALCKIGYLLDAVPDDGFETTIDLEKIGNITLTLAVNSSGTNPEGYEPKAYLYGVDTSASGTSGWWGSADLATVSVTDTTPLIDGVYNTETQTWTFQIPVAHGQLISSDVGDILAIAIVGNMDTGADEFIQFYELNSSIKISPRVNLAPLANADVGLLNENTNVILDVLNNDTDPEDDLLSIINHTQPTNGSVTDQGNGLLNYTPFSDYFGADSFSYTITDGNGETSTATVALTVNTTNQPPVATDSSHSIAENASIGTSVATITANDPDANDTLSFSITSGNTDGSFLINSNGEIITSSVLDYETTQSYNLTVRISDNEGLFDEAVITINLTDNTDEDSDSDGFADVLEVALGTDPNSDLSSPSTLYQNLYAWWQFNETTGSLAADTSGNARVGTISGAPTWGTGNDGGAIQLDGIDDQITYTMAKTTFPAYTVSLWAKADSVNTTNYAGLFNNNSDGSDMQIDTNGGNPGKYQFKGASSASIGNVTTNWVHIVASFNGTSTMLYYNGQLVDEVAGGSGNVFGQLQIGRNRGGANLYFAGSIDDLMVWDRSLDASEVLELGNWNVAPIAQDSSLIISEDTLIGTSVGIVGASDTNNNDTLIYTITEGNSGGEFIINSTTGEITTAANLDYESNSTYSLTVNVSDNGTPSLSDDATITINIIDVNEAPTASDAATSVAENAGAGVAVASVGANDPDAGDTLAYAITSGNDHGLFTVDSNGHITTTDDLDYEAVSSHTLTVTVTDSGSLSDTAAVLVNVNDVNEAPIVDDAVANIAENGGSALVAIVNASDPDAGDSLSYAITAGNTGGAFTIDSDGNLTTATTLDYETLSSYALTVTVTDSGALTDTAMVSVAVTNVNESPIANDTSGSIAEDAIIGTTVANVVASDPDVGDSLSYAITAGNTAGAFTIDSDGNLTTATALDYETLSSYALTVTVTDSGALTDTAMVSVAVTNVNENPIANDTSGSIAEDAIIGTTIANLVASDPDAGDSLSYAITAGNTGGAFTIDSDGNLTTATTLDYETLSSYALTVTVTDSGALTDTATVSVAVTNVNESPIANDTSGSIAEDAIIGTTVANLVASDPDAGDSLSYAITAGNTAGAFTIDSNGNLTTATALDYETLSSYALTVTVTDSGALTDTATVSVSVTDVDETTAPVVITGAASNLSQSGADVAYTVSDDGGEAPTVTVYYGETNGGTVPANWSNSSGQGTKATGGHLTGLSGLTEGTTYYFTVHASNSAGESWGSVGSFTTVADTSPKLVRTTVNAVSNSSWTTVDLGQNYNSAVMIATPIYPNSTTPPVVTRITNVSGSSFDLKLDRADGQTGAVSVDVSIVAVEEGVYTQATDGVTMEAVKYTSTVTADNNSWVGETRSYQNTYTSPVVVGQVMSANDANWSVFWSMGNSRTAPASASVLNVGKHVGEDPNATRANETIGYIVIESGSGTINGVAYEAALGADTVRGFGNSATPYSYSLSGSLGSVNSAALSISGMDGNNGAWAVLSGTNPLTTTSIGLHAVEDQMNDAEQSHATTQVAYLVFE